ncbi:MAG: hypothetical protein IKY53_05255 [Lachnospiraceae bacterium]|nr:hypothetical protein [Lachnospiraceae bacterium]
MKKAKFAIAGILAMMFLVACNQQNPDKIGATTLFADKEGKITETIVEDFSMPQYNTEELSLAIAEEVAAYNSEAGVDTIKLEHFNVENGIVKAQLVYNTASDYEAFNNEAFFNGTISEALAAGYTMDVILQNPANPDETIDLYQILTMQDKKVMITAIPARLRVPSKILYVSEDVTIIDEYEVDAFENADATIIIY